MKPKATTPAPRQMTEEERKEQMTRAFLQKRASLAEGILFNLCQGKVGADTNWNYLSKAECKMIVDVAIDMADHLMEKLYGAKPQE